MEYENSPKQKFYNAESRCELLCIGDFFSWEKYVGQRYSPKNKCFLASFSNDRGLSLDDKTKDYVGRNTRGQVYS